jgi:hypothetical protein
MKGRDLALFAGGVLSTATAIGLYQASDYLTRSARAQENDVGRGGSPNSLGSTSAPHPAPALTGSSARAPQAEGADQAGAERTLERELQRQLDQVNGTLQSVQRERRSLESQLRGLKSQLVTHQKESSRDEFDLDQNDWKALAAEGRIKYRIPCMLPPDGAFKMSEAELDDLGLSQQEADVVTEAHRRSNARIWETIRPLCLELVGVPEVVDLLSVSNCVRLVERSAMKSDAVAASQARQQVAEVHAGMRSEPDPGLAQHPVFEANMALTREAHSFEADLAESFGPDEAKRISRSMRCVATVR